MADTAEHHPAAPGSGDPFADLDAYVALPRLAGLTLSPDGTRLATTVATLDPTRTRYVTAVWEVDPRGERPARRLTHSARGESHPAFSASGDLLFTSARPDPDARPGSDEEPPAALWRLPAGGGEAAVVADRSGGVTGVVAASAVDVVVVTSPVFPGAADAEADARLRAARKERKVSAILHTGYPVRIWDHDLGPDVPHVFAGTLRGAPGAEGAGPRIELRDLTAGVGAELEEADVDVTPDGGTVVVSWRRPGPRAVGTSGLVALDVATGERRTLVAEPEADLGAPTISADGAWVAYLRESFSTPQRAPRVQLAVAGLAPGAQAPQVVAPEWDRWPAEVRWLPGDGGLLVVADEDGRAPVFHVNPATGQVTRLTDDAAAYSDLCVAPDGGAVFALRSSYAAPPHPVRIDLVLGAGGAPTGGSVAVLRGPAPLPGLPGTLTEVETSADDGTRVRSWLVLPAGADAGHPAPLLLWIHGGPLASWNAWSWRWNPWILAARGYAVLLPDPALSLGYGQDFVQRGWGAWGGPPFTDLMAATDAAVARPDIDGARTAAMGGSFGGYMANWVAGHTDRFRAVVTHASLWALDQFGPTTDFADYWLREMTAEMALANSPHRAVGDIVTPMLVIHGDHDYRVPIGEGLRLWFELLTASGLPAAEDGTSPHRFLYFPDENHWVLSPQHAIVWYRVVEAFLARHVLGEERDLPEVLGL